MLLEIKKYLEEYILEVFATPMPRQQIDHTISQLRSNRSSTKVFVGHVSLACAAAACILLKIPRDALYKKLSKFATSEPIFDPYGIANFSLGDRDNLIESTCAIDSNRCT